MIFYGLLHFDNAPVPIHSQTLDLNCDNCHLPDGAFALVEPVDACGYCHQKQEPMFLIPQHELEQRLDVLGAETLNFALSESTLRRDQRFEQVMTHYFSAVAALKEASYSPQKLTTAYLSLAEAEALLRTLENEAQSGYWVNNTASQPIQMFIGAARSTIQFASAMLPGGVLNIAPVLLFSYLQKLALIGVMLLITLLIHHRGPPAVFDSVRASILELQGLPFSRRAIPVVLGTFAHDDPNAEQPKALTLLFVSASRAHYVYEGRGIL